MRLSPATAVIVSILVAFAGGFITGYQFGSVTSYAQSAEENPKSSEKDVVFTENYTLNGTENAKSYNAIINNS